MTHLYDTRKRTPGTKPQQNMANRPKARLSRLSSIFWFASIVFGAIFAKQAFTNYGDVQESDFLFQMKWFSGTVMQ